MKLIKFKTKEGFLFCVPEELKNFAGSKIYKCLGIVENVKFTSERDKKYYTELYDKMIEKKDIYIKTDLYKNNSFINIDKKEMTDNEKRYFDREYKRLKQEGKLPSAAQKIINKLESL